MSTKSLVVIYEEMIARRNSKLLLKKHCNEMLAFLKTYLRVVESDDYAAWQSAAELTHMRMSTPGYAGETLPSAKNVRALIAKVEGTQL